MIDQNKIVFNFQKRSEPWKTVEIGGIVISPTRELAMQTSNVLENFLKNIPSLKQVLLIGGTSMENDVKKIEQGCNIIIATPGRLEDLFSNCKKLNLASYVKSLVFYFILIYFKYIYTVICGLY